MSDVDAASRDVVELEEAEDVFRSSVLRFAGYANEVGEAFRPVAPLAFVRATYAVAVSYASAHAATKAAAADEGERAAAAGETLLWQALASVVLPSLVINRSVWATRKLLAPMPAVGTLARVRGFAPTAVGLALIPAIVGPLDAVTDAVMDHARAALRKD